jgi:hypothetical protein
VAAHAQPVTLTGHTARGRSTSRSGFLIAFGLLFVAVGVGVGWLAFRQPDWSDKTTLALQSWFCIIFAGAGLALSLSGVAAIIRRSRIERRMRQHADEFWAGDYPWNPDGAREHPISASLQGLVGLLAFALFLAPFHWMVVKSLHDGVLFVLFVVGIFDLVLALMVWVWLQGILRALKYGAAWIRFDTCPFYLGEMVAVRLGCRSFATLTKIVVTLRFVREATEMHGDSTRTVCYEHWAEKRTFTPEQMASREELAVTIQLPPDKTLETCLSESPASYWEVEMKGEASGIDEVATFLVPVYRR